MGTTTETTNGASTMYSVDAPTETYLSRLFVGIKKSLQTLGAEPCDEQMERLALFIYESMSVSSRYYHNIQHPLVLAENQTDPILVLAAFYHDVVYYQVDGGLSLRQASIVKDAIEEKDSSVYLSASCDESLLSMVERIFGFECGQKVGQGLNEFLSALVAVRELQTVLNPGILAQIACCIEATIPFRPPNEDGSAMERLYTRMMKTNLDFHLGLSQEKVVEAVQRAARLANLDVRFFATTDRASFIGSDWQLLPEMNKILRSLHVYTIQDYQGALFHWQEFASFVNPKYAFQSFRGVPGEVERMTAEATVNFEMNKEYNRVKLLSASVVLAFAVLTGGDAPMSLFLGDFPSRQLDYWHHALTPALPPHQDCNLTIHQVLLEKERKMESSFDRLSPVTAFLYSHLGDTAVKEILRDCAFSPMGDEAATCLLSHLLRQLALTLG